MLGEIYQIYSTANNLSRKYACIADTIAEALCLYAKFACKTVKNCGSINVSGAERSSLERQIIDLA
jgi:hypothetical protein